MALTAYHSSETVERCETLGMKAVYHKPANINDIKHVLYAYHFNLTPAQSTILENLNAKIKEIQNEKSA